MDYLKEIDEWQPVHKEVWMRKKNGKDQERNIKVDGNAHNSLTQRTCDSITKYKY